MSRSLEPFKSSWVITLAATVVLIGALYLAQGVLVPLTLAVLLSFVLAPLCDWLERSRLGRVPAVMATAMLAFALLGAVGWTVAVQLSELAGKLPEYKGNIEAKLDSVHAYLRTRLGQLNRTAEEINQKITPSAEELEQQQGSTERSYPVRVLPSPPNPMQIIRGMFGPLVSVLGTTGIVVVFVIFFLIRREDLRDRFIRLIGQGEVTLTTQAIDDAAKRVSRYLSTQLLINASYGAPVALGLYFIGVPNAALWGLLATVLRFLPYLGPWIAASMPIALSLAVSPHWKEPLLTIGMFIALELVSNNVMEPWLYGARTGVSPVAVLVAAVFWTWLWGGVGLLLATPLTVCLAVIGKYVPQLSYLDILLGDQPVFEPKVRIYQRLLAGDAEEAEELLGELLKQQSLVELYDSVLIPALGVAEEDRHRGELDENRWKFIYLNMKEMIEELAEHTEALRVTEDPQRGEPPKGHTSRVVPKSQELRILCLPARDDADEVGAIMLAHLLRIDGFVVESVSVTALTGEVLELIEQRQPTLVCISVMPPFAARHARYLYKRLKSRFPELPVVVGLWNARGDLTKARNRLACGDTECVVNNLKAAREQIRRMVQPLLVRSRRTPGRTGRHKTKVPSS